MSELEQELFEIFCKTWPSQIRELTPCKFLVRFPPHKKVTNLKSLPSFNLRKEGVQVGVIEWIGDVDHFTSLTEFWIQVEGIPSKWCDWKVFTQLTSRLGLLMEVDWSYLFKIFYEKVRLKIVVRSPTKIPQKRLYEMAKKIYLVQIMVEGYECDNEKSSKPDDDGDEHDRGGEESNDDDDLDDSPERMDTEKNVGEGNQG
jgi:hypothetical protein